MVVWVFGEDAPKGGGGGGGGGFGIWHIAFGWRYLQKAVTTYSRIIQRINRQIERYGEHMA